MKSAPRQNRLTRILREEFWRRRKETMCVWRSREFIVLAERSRNSTKYITAAALLLFPRLLGKVKSPSGPGGYTYGEALVDEHATDESPFRFSGRTRRHHRPLRPAHVAVTRRFDVVRVDPLYERYPDMSPYVYLCGNPVKFIDPDGREFDEL